jgi:maleate isomerase
MTSPSPTYGRRGVVGVIDLSTCTSLIPEFAMAMPRDVGFVFSRLRLPDGVVSVPTLQAMVSSPRFEEAALELADAGTGVIAFACTSASLLLGPGFDRELSERLRRATGVQATTTATAVIAALRNLGARRISVGTPYDAEITARERAFLEAAGHQVAAIEGVGLELDREIGALAFEDVEALARRVHRPGVDAVFLSCTNLPALPVLASLERELGCPVLSSNAATIWHCLTLLGVAPEAGGLGRLLGPPA